MSNVLSLDDIRSKTEEKYGSLTVPFGDGQSVTFRNLLRIAKFEREQFLALSEELATADGRTTERSAELIGEMLQVVATRDEEAIALLAEIDGDLAVLGTLLEAYTKGTHLGEAEGSQS